MIHAWVEDENVMRLTAALDRMPPEIRKKLQGVIRELAKTLRSQVQALAPRATGKLRRSIKYGVSSGPEWVKGSVWADAPYAGILEFGLSKDIAVKQHIRTLTEVFGHRMVSTRRIMVRAYSRHVEAPERSYLRWGLMEMKSQIETEIGEVASEVVDEQS